MTLKTKQRVVLVWLVIFGLWPILHYGLVQHYHLSPWRFFGWAMYCLPKQPVDVDIQVVTDDGSRQLRMQPQDRALLRREVREFERLREMWGKLLPPDDLAEFFFDRFPAIVAIEVRLEQLVLDRKTALLVGREYQYDYRRSQFPAQTKEM